MVFKTELFMVNKVKQKCVCLLENFLIYSSFDLEKVKVSFDMYANVQIQGNLTMKWLLTLK